MDLTLSDNIINRIIAILEEEQSKNPTLNWQRKAAGIIYDRFIGDQKDIRELERHHQLTKSINELIVGFC